MLAALVAGSSLTGCGFLHSHFGKKDPEYRKAVQEHPLEVPPDLDTPNSSGALVVPSVSAPASTVTPATGAVPPESAGASPTGTAPPTAVAGVTLAGDGLQVSDSVDHTWSRVGLALERSGAATIVSRDEGGHAYAVETTGRTTSKAGWFKRAITLGRAGNKQTARVALTVRVSADGNGSKVSVEGAADEASRDAARALLASLRQRLS
jgi:uncharacterized lipoprotein